MIPTHSREHDRVLERASVGDIDRDDPDLTALLEECPECRDRMDGLVELEGLLERAAEEQRAVLAGLEPEREPPGSDLVAPFVHARVEEQRRRVPWLPLAAAAALVATTGGVWIAARMAERTPREATFLGSSTIHFQGARERVVPYGPVQWEAEAAPRDGFFEIRILDARGTPLPGLDTRRLEQPEWMPSPEEEELLPDEFRLEVTVMSAFGEPSDFDWVLVRR